MRLELHIERLILDGLTLGPGDEARLRVAFEAELGRLLAERGLAQQLAGGMALPALAAPTITLGGGESPAQLGRQVAQSVAGSIGGGE